LLTPELNKDGMRHFGRRRERRQGIRTERRGEYNVFASIKWLTTISENVKWSLYFSSGERRILTEGNI
jgi:hypothetical protein